MTSSGSFPLRLTLIDDLTRPDHSYLNPDDVCCFIGEYTARGGFLFSETNNLISNLKKPVDRRHLPEWRYKEQAIHRVAQTLRSILHPQWLDETTFVPIPPSKIKTHPLYDDRLIRILQAIRQNPLLDIRELVVQVKSMDAAHLLDIRPRPAELENNYQLDESLIAPSPRRIAIFDDMLTTGCHFRAVQAMLRRFFPQVEIIGLFIARREVGTTDI
jgi:hypothetical protein